MGSEHRLGFEDHHANTRSAAVSALAINPRFWVLPHHVRMNEQQQQCLCFP